MADLTHLVQQAQHRTQPKVLESDIGRKAFGFGREDLDGGASYYEGEFKLFLRSGNGTLENTEMGASTMANGARAGSMGKVYTLAPPT